MNRFYEVSMTGLLMSEPFSLHVLCLASILCIIEYLITKYCIMILAQSRIDNINTYERYIIARK